MYKHRKRSNKCSSKPLFRDKQVKMILIEQMTYNDINELRSREDEWIQCMKGSGLCMNKRNAKTHQTYHQSNNLMYDNTIHNMPYNNPANQAVARDINTINRRYIAHTDMLGTTNAINYVNPAIEPEGQILSGFGHMGRIVGGGIGCADFHRSSASKHYSEDKDGLSGSAILGLQDGTLAGDRTKPKSRVRKNKAVTDTDNKERFGALGNALPSDIGLSDQNVPAATFQQGFAQKDDSPLETQPASFARALGFSQATGSGKRKPRVACPCGAKIKRKCKCLEGGNGFATGSHMDTGFGVTLGAKDNGGVKSTGNLSLADTPRKTLRSKKQGGAILGLVKPPVQDKMDSTVSEQKPAPGTTTKKTLRSTSKKELEKPVEKAQMPSSTISGLGKPEGILPKQKPKRQASAKAVSRAALVKKVMAEKKLSLPEASKYIKANNLAF